ncbi:MAG: hypothetical protein IKR26_04410 [Lachnospiraceae bacterium]|nr:hypothetical protein [Lachnospiraceae bacterium]
MKKVEARALRADEVEVRIGTAKKDGTGVSLLLYKDARCDMNMLDEIVGPGNWQKSYEMIGDELYCTVSIWDDDKKTWVSKTDVGTESYTEAVKGRASDAFKRACVNWFGIGRELYTAPFIWISGATKDDKFWVMDMMVENHRITKLIIGKCDRWGSPTNESAFVWPRQSTYQNPAPVAKEQKADEFAKVNAVAAAVNKPAGLSDKEIMAIEALMERKGVTLEQISKRYGVKSIGELTSKQYVSCLGALNATPDKVVGT